MGRQAEATVIQAAAPHYYRQDRGGAGGSPADRRLEGPADRPRTSHALTGRAQPLAPFLPPDPPAHRRAKS